MGSEELKTKILEHIISKDDRQRLPVLRTTSRKELARLIENGVIEMISAANIVETSQQMHSVTVVVKRELVMDIKKKAVKDYKQTSK